MKLKTILLAILVAAFVFPVVSQRTMTLADLKKMGKSATTTEPAKNEQQLRSNPVKKGMNAAGYMYEGLDSKVDKPFIFVVRDKETYAMLGALVDGLEPEADVDFDKFAIVAAFSGVKSTGGYSVSIMVEEGKTMVSDVEPVHGAIVTEALTRPFAVAKVPVEEENSLELVADETWNAQMEEYEVTSGKFDYSGGFVGMSKSFEVSGSISVLKFGEHMSMFFDLSEKGGGTRMLFEAASGATKSNSPAITRLEAGKLIDKPHPPFMIKAGFDGEQMELIFSPGKRSYVVSDGFEGKGTVTAVKITGKSD